MARPSPPGFCSKNKPNRNFRVLENLSGAKTRSVYRVLLDSSRSSHSFRIVPAVGSVSVRSTSRSCMLEFCKVWNSSGGGFFRSQDVFIHEIHLCYNWKLFAHSTFLPPLSILRCQDREQLQPLFLDTHWRSIDQTQQKSNSLQYGGTSRLPAPCLMAKALHSHTHITQAKTLFLHSSVPLLNSIPLLVKTTAISLWLRLPFQFALLM